MSKKKSWLIGIAAVFVVVSMYLFYQSRQAVQEFEQILRSFWVSLELNVGILNESFSLSGGAEGGEAGVVGHLVGKRLCGENMSKRRKKKSVGSTWSRERSLQMRTLFRIF